MKRKKWYAISSLGIATVGGLSLTLTACGETSSSNDNPNDNPGKSIPISTLTPSTKINVSDGYKKVYNDVEQMITQMSATPIKMPVAGNPVFPQVMKFTGQNGNAQITALNLDASLAGYTLTYIDNEGNQISNLSNANISNDQSVYVILKDSTGKMVGGQKYKVAGLGNLVEHGIDNFSESIFNKRSDVNEVISEIDKMQKGNEYMSGLDSSALPGMISGINSNMSIQKSQPIPDHIFAPFMDVGYGESFLKSDTNLSKLSGQYSQQVWAFLQSNRNNGVIDPQWAGSVSMSGDSESVGGEYVHAMDFLRKQGSTGFISLGGLTGSPIWEGADPLILAKQLDQIITDFGLTRIDYDVEGADVSKPQNIENLSIATALLQRKYENEGKDIDISLTMPADTGGLSAWGVTALEAFVNNGVRIKILNGMTMMMSQDKTLLEGMTTAIDGLKNQLQTAYAKVGVTFTDEQAYNMIGATFDISSDTWKNEQISSADDVNKILDLAKSKHIGMLGYWALNNDEDGMNSAGHYNSFIGTGQIHQILKSFDDAFPKTHTATKDIYSSWSNDDINSRVMNALYNRYKIGQPDNPYAGATRPADGQPIQSGEVFIYPSPYDGTDHYWRANFYASGTERPNTPQSESQFTDLGPISQAKELEQLAQLKKDAAKYEAAISQVNTGQAGEISVMKMIQSITGSSKINTYAAGTYVAGDVVLYNGVGYLCNYWTQSAPEGANIGQGKPWTKLFSA